MCLREHCSRVVMFSRINYLIHPAAAAAVVLVVTRSPTAMTRQVAELQQQQLVYASRCSTLETRCKLCESQLQHTFARLEDVEKQLITEKVNIVSCCCRLPRSGTTTDKALVSHVI